MNFAHPEYLLLLVGPIALALWSIFQHGAPVNAPVAEGSLVAQPVTFALLKAGAMLPSLLLGCFVFLLARPVTEQQVLSRNPAKTTNIEILLNASSSMLARSEIGYHCRYCASKVVIGDFVKKRNGNTIGISIFGSRHLNLVPLTSDLNCIPYSIAETYPDYISYGISHEKNFAEGITRSVEKLKENAQPGSEQILILITDGENPELARRERELLTLMVQEDVTLYVAMIADGTRSPTLARLAEGTRGGRLFECRDAMGFLEVMRHIDRMNKIVYKDAAPRAVDNNWHVLLGAAGILCFFGVYLATPFRPIPW